MWLASLKGLSNSGMRTFAAKCALWGRHFWNAPIDRPRVTKIGCSYNGEQGYTALSMPVNRAGGIVQLVRECPSDSLRPLIFIPLSYQAHISLERTSWFPGAVVVAVSSFCARCLCRASSSPPSRTGPSLSASCRRSLLRMAPHTRKATNVIGIMTVKAMIVPCKCF